MCCNRIERAEPGLLCFSRLQVVILKDFVMFLKQGSGSKLKGSRLEGSRDEKGIQQSVASDAKGK